MGWLGIRTINPRSKKVIILIETKDKCPKPIRDFTDFDKDCIKLMKKYNLGFLQHENGCMVSDHGVPLTEQPGYTIVV
jgi:16S rRNA C1402 (ribose-2'-O) methylase RsmI